MSPERRFYEEIRRKAPAYWALIRVENVIGRGTPDLCFCVAGNTFWVECKAGSKHPVLRPEQFAWHHRWNEAQGTVFIWNKRPDGTISIYDVETGTPRPVCGGILLETPLKEGLSFDGLIEFVEDL